MIDKAKLRKRLDMMAALPSDWDGFGTEPINTKVHAVVFEMIELTPESTYGMQIFCGVQNDGSCYLEYDLNRKLIEMTVLADGTIHFDEVVANGIVGSGSFFLTEQNLNDLLSS